MTSSDAPPTSRRALRAQAERERAAAAAAAQVPMPVAAAQVSAPVAASLASEEPAPALATTEPESAVTGTPRRVALGWVDPDVIAGLRAPSDLSAASSAYVPVLPEILPRRRSPKSALVSLGIVAALAGGYTAATQLWPLDGVAPVVTPGEVVAVAAPASQVDWPEAGVAAVGVRGMGHTIASDTEPTTMASITKLVSVLMVLDQAPLEPGESGFEREIAYSDRVDYWSFLGRGESAIDVPVGETLTQHQLMQGALIASAGNYTAMLTREFWPTDEEFADAARAWLDEKKLDGITVVEPTGIDRRNTADATSLIRLASMALADPVVAEIVATDKAELPGIGEIENTNPILGEDGIVGVKTGSFYGSYNLLAAREVTVGDTTAYALAAVLGQPTESLRGTETARLLDQVAAELSQPTVLAAGTPVASVSTAWGTEAEIRTAADAAVLLWNKARLEAKTDVSLGDARAAGDAVGELRLEGPLDSAVTDLTLSADLGEPDMWWRFTHPLQLWGIAR